MNEIKHSHNETNPSQAAATPTAAAPTADVRHGAGWLPSWDGGLYAANTGHHRAYDDWFLESFPVRATDRVLDVGCGSGDFTSKVAAFVPDGEVVGLDPQASMLEVARTGARPNQRFVLAGAQEMGSALDGERFDAVFSRATFQWIPLADYAPIFAAVHGLLRPGGWFRLECGGAGNVPRVVDLVGEVSTRHGGPLPRWTFADPGRHLELLEAAGFDTGGQAWVRSVAQRRSFSADSLVGWLRSQCYQAFDEEMSPDQRGAFRAEVEGRLTEMRRADGTFDQTFVRIDALVYRPPA